MYVKPFFYQLIFYEKVQHARIFKSYDFDKILLYMLCGICRDFNRYDQMTLLILNSNMFYPVKDMTIRKMIIFYLTWLLARFVLNKYKKSFLCRGI